ncbi:DUF3459 domain-containing protein [Streptomyces sp. B15]|uniref:DUF3459 domain-containing protein n=1 Tax=Streptomyces sp. B15 TaxID=1537797 RepID=UPI001B372306|nr:DUF3459 domain-containing protein [Streptomyces sp. B15]MBQ1124428.1 DUF3459 domain-containing protein [Streptomyces sp. B15]
MRTGKRWYRAARLYRTALRLRRAFRDAGELRRLPTEAPHVLSFARTVPDGGGTVLCVVNFGPPDVALPAHRELLLASGP